MATQPVVDFATARAHFESLFDHGLSNPDLLREALHAGGPRMIGIKYVPEGNKRLALVGDAAIDAVVMHTAYIAGLSKGDMDILRQSTASNSNLDRLGRAKNIGECLTLSPGTTQISSNMMATAAEAIFGAFFEDSGLDMHVMKRGWRAFSLL